MSLTLITGDLGKAVRDLTPDICVNFTTPRGSAITPLGSVLYKQHPTYMQIISEIKSSYTRDYLYYGTFKWMKDPMTGQILIAAFTEVVDSGPEMDPALKRMLVEINRDAVQCGASSVLLSHYKTGFEYSFCDFVDDINEIFDPSLTVYIATTDRYAKNLGLPLKSYGNRKDRPGITRPHRNRYLQH